MPVTDYTGGMPESERVRNVMEEVIQQILVDAGRPPRDLQKTDRFTHDVGLDSLDLAVMVVQLEQRLGIDPFREGARPVATLGELAALYERALAEDPSPSDQPGAERGAGNEI